MSRLKDSKNVYDNIPIPDRLEETVASAIEQPLRGRKEDHGVGSAGDREMEPEKMEKAGVKWYPAADWRQPC